MPECHKCRWNDEPPSPAKGAACLACYLPPDRVNHQGKIWVSFDSGPSVQSAAEVQAARAAANNPGEDLAIDLSDPAVRAAMELGGLRIIQYFLDLDPADLSLLMMSLRQSFAETGRQINRTRAAVSAAFRKVVDRHPELAGVVNGDRGRKPPADPSKPSTPARTRPRATAAPAPAPAAAQGDLFAPQEGAAR